VTVARPNGGIQSKTVLWAGTAPAGEPDTPPVGQFAGWAVPPKATSEVVAGPADHSSSSPA
jgi:hypothetical protein